ncbi:uncharacterized protein M6D78_014320 isoform 3-T5 [Vipera latastei]
MAAPSRLRSGRGGAECLFLVDIKDENLDNPETGPCKDQAQLMEEALSAAEDFSVPGQENIKVEASSMSFLPLYGDDSKGSLLVLTDPQDKNKGNLCDGHTSQCYLLPVLDTMFVRKKFRRRGLAMEMLQDFCQAFPSEEALGLSHPLSAEMEKVCQKFLETHPMEQPRLWEAEAPGDWTQRVNIWLKLQLEQSFPKNADQSSPRPKGPDDEAEEERRNTVQPPWMDIIFHPWTHLEAKEHLTQTLVQPGSGLSVQPIYQKRVLFYRKTIGKVFTANWQVFWLSLARWQVPPVLRITFPNEAPLSSQGYYHGLKLICDKMSYYYSAASRGINMAFS